MALVEIVNYVVSDTFFWPSMGFTTATAMFIGVLLHDGNMKQVGKAEITIISYAAFLLATTIPRVLSHLPNTSPSHIPVAFAGTTTIFLVTIFYSMGLAIGVLIAWIQRKRHKNISRSNV